MNLQVAMDVYRTAKSEYARLASIKAIETKRLKDALKQIDERYKERLKLLKEQEASARTAAIDAAMAAKVVGQHDFPNGEWVRITPAEKAIVTDLDALLESPIRDVVIKSVILEDVALSLAKRGRLPGVIVETDVKAAFHFEEEKKDA